MPRNIVTLADPPQQKAAPPSMTIAEFMAEVEKLGLDPASAPFYETVAKIKKESAAAPPEKLSARERAMCAEMKLDPKAYAVQKAAKTGVQQ